MRKLTVLTIVFVLLFVVPTKTLSFEVSILGCSLDQWEDTEPLPMLVGVVSSVLVHTLGHLGYAWVNDIDVHVSLSSSGISEVISGKYSDSDAVNFAGAGFIFQHGTTLVLMSLDGTRHSDFVKGFSLSTVVGALTYSTRHSDDGDFQMMDDYGGNGNTHKNVVYGLCAVELFAFRW